MTRNCCASCVATVTELWNFIRLLYAKLGTRYCPDCEVPVEKQSIAAIEKTIRKTVTQGVMGVSKVSAALKTRSDDHPYLTGIHTPMTEELTLTELKVDGTIPAEIDGRYLRIGPNPVTPPKPATYHWFIGDGMPSNEQMRLHAVAHEHIMTNMEMVKPGVTFEELTFGGHMLDDEFLDLKYGSKFHGVGLCDEWPAIKYPQDHAERAYPGVLEAGMMLCVEAYIGVVGGKEGIKLEDQILVTETGYENLTTCPFDPKLLS